MGKGDTIWYGSIIFFATEFVFERILAPRSRFFEKVNGLRDLLRLTQEMAQRCFSLRILDSHKESQGMHKAAIRNINNRLDRKRISQKLIFLDLADSKVRPYNLPQSAKVKRSPELLIQEKMQLSHFKFNLWFDECVFPNPQLFSSIDEFI
ncbi:hypothetical protein LXL04_032514 [Taraxacum kok-saghyz]